MFKLSELKVNSFSFFGIKKVDKISLNFDKVISIHSNLIFFLRLRLLQKGQSILCVIAAYSQKEF